jgi:MFS transporter, DHA2 family, multidrug resistance protein
MRNLGSSFGTSIVTTLLAERTQRHQNYLVANITPSNPLWHSSVQSLSQQLHSSGLSAGQAQMQAYGRLYRSLSQQAQTLAYIDTYWLLAMGACTMAVLALFARRNNPKASAGSVAAH